MEAGGGAVVFGAFGALGAAGGGVEAAGAGAGGAGGAARAGGGFSATVTLFGPSSEIATNATAVDVIAKARTMPTTTAGMCQPRPPWASAVPQSRHQSWPSWMGAPQVAQVGPVGVPGPASRPAA